MSRSDKGKASKAGWRDSFLMERGKMTSVRYEKIKDSIRRSSNSTTINSDILRPPFVSDVANNDLLLLEKPR